VQKDTYTLIDGRNRYDAYKKLGKKKVKVKILDIPNSELRAEAIRRNIKHGKRLTKSEIKRSVIQLRRVDKKSVEEVAKIVGLTPGRVSQIIQDFWMLNRSFYDFNSKNAKERKPDLRVKVDEEKKEEIIKDLEAGKSGKEVAEKYNVSQPTISRFKKEHEEWSSCPVYIKAEFNRIHKILQTAFVNGLLKKARFEFKPDGIVIKNSNGKKLPYVIAGWSSRERFFIEYRVNEPFEGYAESDIITELPIKKRLNRENIKLALVDEKTWKIGYNSYVKGKEYGSLEWRNFDFPLPSLKLDADGLPETVHVKAKIRSRDQFPRNQKGILFLLKLAMKTCFAPTNLSLAGYVTKR